MSILRSCHVKERSIIDYQFRASSTGYVGAVFKYKDSSNYYTFEVGGGDDISKRFFQIRKKLDGQFSIVKRISTNKEVEQLPFFGYERNTWYAVSIELLYDEIKVFISLVGVTAKMQLMKVKENSIAFGRAGFSTCQTEAAFSEIYIRPVPVPLSNFLFYNLKVKDHSQLVCHKVKLKKTHYYLNTSKMKIWVKMAKTVVMVLQMVVLVQALVQVLVQVQLTLL
jgi:hypothetical protein